MRPGCRSDLRDGVAEVVIDNAVRRNALSLHVITELTAALCDAQKTAAAGDARALVLRGEGDHFSAGLDLKDPALWDGDARTRGRAVAALHGALAAVPVPVIAAVEGCAIAGAAGLVFGCDFVVMGAQAFVQVPEVRMGLSAPFNVAWLTLQHGARVATEIVLTAERLSAERLHALGIVREITSDGEAAEGAIRFARRLADLPADGLRINKLELLAAARDPAGYLNRQLALA